VRVLEDNAKLRLTSKDLITGSTEFFRTDIGGGVSLDGCLIKPKDFDPAKKYPVLIYVYGEPAGQTVVDSWDASTGSFNRTMAQAGYLVASFDNRGTPAPKGRQWRKIVYSDVGVLSSKEQALALQVLERARPYIDPDRVAVWERSGGGSNTLNLMFRHPELYKVGMAVAPVADQRLYDGIYQERYITWDCRKIIRMATRRAHPLTSLADFRANFCWFMVRTTITSTTREPRCWSTGS
jgi:dipeptidyl-peptidase 4